MKFNYIFTGGYGLGAEKKPEQTTRTVWLCTGDLRSSLYHLRNELM